MGTGSQLGSGVSETGSVLGSVGFGWAVLALQRVYLNGNIYTVDEQ